MGAQAADHSKANQRLDQMHMRSDQIAKGADTILVNYRVGAAGAPGRAPAGPDASGGQRLPDAYQTTQMNGNRSGKIHSSQQTQVVQVLTPQLYSQQRQRVATGILPGAAGGVAAAMHNTQQMVGTTTGMAMATTALMGQSTSHQGVSSLSHAQ